MRRQILQEKLSKQSKGSYPSDAGVARSGVVGFRDKRHCVRQTVAGSLFCLVIGFPLVAETPAEAPDVQAIIAKSVQANKRDFDAAPQYNKKERDRTADGTKLYQVTMIEGTPYQRLIAINGEPLSNARQ